MLKNMKLATKMALGVGLPLAILCAVMIVTLVISGRVERNSTQAQHDIGQRVQLAETAMQMKLNVVQVQQWLTDISATRAQDGLDDGFDEAAANAKQFHEGLEAFRDYYEQQNDSTALRNLDEMEQAFEAYYKQGQRMANANIDDGTAAGNSIMGDFDTVAAALTEKLEPFVEQQQKIVKERSQ